MESPLQDEDAKAIRRSRRSRRSPTVGPLTLGRAEAKQASTEPPPASDIYALWDHHCRQYYGYVPPPSHDDARLMFSHAKLRVPLSAVADTLQLAFWLIENDEHYCAYRKDEGERVLTYQEAVQIAAQASTVDATVSRLTPGSWDDLLAAIAKRFGETWAAEKSHSWPVAMRCLRYGVLGLPQGWWRSTDDHWLAALFVTIRDVDWREDRKGHEEIAERACAYIRGLPNAWEWLLTSPRVCEAVVFWRMENKYVEDVLLPRRIAICRTVRSVLSAQYLLWKRDIGMEACSVWHDWGPLLGPQETRHVCYGLTADYDAWLSWAMGE